MVIVGKQRLDTTLSGLHTKTGISTTSLWKSEKKITILSLSDHFVDKIQLIQHTLH